uniref:Uncharacterized protein n=1 Tax=Avena sativa TaxID=4498 RepID=A0ACD5ZKG8_AVESA
MPSSSTFASSSSLFHIVPLDRGATGRYAMDACYLCGKPLPRNLDIFMYRGDAPFCSEECRGVQMDMDEARERINTNAILKERAARNEQRRGTPSTQHNVTCASNVPVAS